MGPEPQRTPPDNRAAQQKDTSKPTGNTQLSRPGEPTGPKGTKRIVATMTAAHMAIIRKRPGSPKQGDQFF